MMRDHHAKTFNRGKVTTETNATYVELRHINVTLELVVDSIDYSQRERVPLETFFNVE